VRRRKLLGWSVVAALPGIASAQQTQTPQAFLQALYDPYLRRDFRGQPYWEAARFFAPELARAMDRDMRQAKQQKQPPTLNGDPFVDAQEWSVSDLVVRASGAGETATGVVSFANFGQPKRLAIDLVKTPSGWRIADIAGSSGSLRMLYKIR
jgi:hypothetical protein